MEINLKEIERKIYIIRNQKVMLDTDLAELYSVETSQLTRSVQRNSVRFPEDFAFKLNPEEFRELNLLKRNDGNRERRRGFPMAFTENGVAMLSSVLNSDRAILVNIAIMRIFTHLRSFSALENQLSDRVNKLEATTSKVFKIVFERLDEIDECVKPHLPSRRKKIGL